MNSKSIFYPVLALVFFTLFIALWVAFTRIGHLRRNRVHPQALADGKRWDEILSDVENPSDAFENLFEMPVLFYAVTLAIYTTGLVDATYIIVAWMFVFFRIAQGLIHCTYNRIMHRAMSFWFGSVILFILWIRFAIQILSSH